MNNLHNGEKRQTEKTETIIEKVVGKGVEIVASENFVWYATIGVTAVATVVPIVASLLGTRGLAASENPTTGLKNKDIISSPMETVTRKLHEVKGHSRTIGDSGLFGKGYAAGTTIPISKHKRGG